MRALIIVDMQYDFVSELGALSVPGAMDMCGALQEYAAQFEGFVVLTGDWHPETHISFKDRDGPWPKHCVAFSRGARFQAGLDCMRRANGWPVIYKGMRSETEEYSGFANPQLDSMLKLRGIEDIELCGVARNYCVRHTADDAEKLGYRTTVLESLCRSV